MKYLVNGWYIFHGELWSTYMYKLYGSGPLMLYELYEYK